MNDAVSPFFGSPVLLRTGFNTGFTSISVDAQVMTPDGSKYDVLYVGTSTGQLLKAVNALSPVSVSTTRPVIIEEVELMSGPVKKGESSEGPMLSSHWCVSVRVVSTKKGPGHVIVTSAEEVKSVSLYRCEKAGSCSECVGLQDPHCAWSVRDGQCAGAQRWAKGSQAAFLQNVPTGRHASCPGDLVARTPDHRHRNLGTVINQVDTATRTEATEHRQGSSGHSSDSKSPAETDNPTIEASVVLFSLETLIITVSAGAVAALVLGFVTGYCCGRKCGKEESNVPYTDAEYEYFEQRQLPPRPLQPSLHPLLQHTDKRPQEETLYAEPILVNHQVNSSNPLGTTLASKAYVPISGMTLVGGAGGGLGLHPAAKFNTISNIHKRGGGECHLSDNVRV